MIGRRRFLAGSGAAALAASLPATSLGKPSSRVLVHCLEQSDFAGCALLDGANPFWHEAVSACLAEQADMLARFEAAGEEVVHLEDLLGDAIGRARRDGSWSDWLAAHHPRLQTTADAAALLRDSGPFSLGAPDPRQAELIRFALGELRATRLGGPALRIV